MTIARRMPAAAPATPVQAALVAQEPAAAWRVPGAAVSTGAMTLLGGARALKRWPQSRAEIHGTLVQGLPASMLLSLLVAAIVAFMVWTAFKDQ